MTETRDRIPNSVFLEKNPDKINMAAVFALLFAFAGLYGFVYEMIFYFFNGGMKEIYWRGSCFGPWILIYGLGSFVIYFLTHRLRKHPSLVCLAGGLGCGALEWISGAVLYYGFGGHRGWNYTVERWNFGNIGGFICLRSVVVFGLSSMLLIYLVLPFILHLERTMHRKAFRALAFSCAALFLLDNLYNVFIAPAFHFLMTANELYSRLGFHIMNFG